MALLRGEQARTPRPIATGQRFHTALCTWLWQRFAFVYCGSRLEMVEIHFAIYTASEFRRNRTIACTGAGGRAGFKWTVITAGPVMRDVELNRSAEEFVG